jgi:hypothetical protein
MKSHEIPDEIDDLIDWAADDVYQGQDSPSWSPYNQGVQRMTIWAIEKAQGTVNNGGFQFFFENDWPGNPEYVLFVEAFQRIGALEAADCLQDAIDMFPSESPHLDREMRRSYLASLREKQGRWKSVIDKLGDRVRDQGGETFILLAAYILRHIEEFPAANTILKSDLALQTRLDQILRKSAVGMICSCLHRFVASRCDMMCCESN